MFNIKYVLFLLILYLPFTISCSDKRKNTPIKNSETTQETFTNLRDLGNEHWRVGNYQEALEYFTKAYKLVKSSKNELETATLLNNLGLVHWRLENNTAAMECYNEAAILADKNNMKRLLGLTHTNRALILKEQRNFEAAFIHNNKAIDIFREINKWRDLAIAYNNQGQIYRFSGATEKALKFYLLSLEECKKINYSEGMATAYQNLSTIYAKKGNRKKTIEAGQKSLKLSYKVKSKVRISEGLRELANNYEIFNEKDSALYYFKKHYVLDKEILESNQSDLLSQYQANLGLEVKNLRIKNLQNEKEIDNTRFMLSAVFVLTALLISSFIIYYYLSSIKFKKKQLEVELENSKQIIDVKEQELKTYIIDLAQKNSIINKLQKPTQEEVNLEYSIDDLMEQKIFTDDGWNKFKKRFAEIYPDFFVKITHHNIYITEAEIRLLVLMRLKLNGNDMANILGISPQSVRVCKMRLKKKLQVNNYNTVEEYLQYIVS